MFFERSKYNIYSYRYIYLIFILICNIYAYFITVNDGYLSGDYLGYIIDVNTFFPIVILFVIIFYYIVIDVLFKISSSFKINDSFVCCRNLSYFVLIYQSVFFLFNNVYGINVAGSTDTTSNPLKYLFLILNADYLFVVYFALNINNSNKKLMLLNVLVYILSTLSRGWLGGVVLLAFFFIFFNFSKKNWKLFFLALSISISLALMSPVIYEIRNIIRFDLELSELSINLDSYYNFIFLFLEKLILRFQNYTPLYFVIDNLNNYFNIQPIYSQGSIPTTLYRMLGYTGSPLSSITAEHWLGNLGRNTAFSTTIIPYFLISFTSAIATSFYFFIAIVSSGLIVRLFNSPELKFVTWYYLVGIFASGWSAAFFSFWLAMLIVLVINTRFRINI